MWNRCPSFGAIKILFRAAEKQIKGDRRSTLDWMSTCRPSSCSKKQPKAVDVGASAILRGGQSHQYRKEYHEPPLFGVACDLCWWDRMSFTAGGILRVVVSQIVPQKLQQGCSGWMSWWDFSSPLLSPLLQPEQFCRSFHLKNKYFVVWNLTNLF